MQSSDILSIHDLWSMSDKKVLLTMDSSLPDFLFVFVDESKGFSLGGYARFDDKTVSKVEAWEGESQPWGHSEAL